VAKRDLILAFFSNPSKATDPERFVYTNPDWKNAPFVYSVPDKYSCPGLTRPQGPRPCPVPNVQGFSCPGGIIDECSGGIRDFGFATSVREHVQAGGGSPLAYYTNQATKLSGGDTWGRIAVVTFSAGHSGARQLMAIDSDQIDTYISLDSLTLAKDGNGKFLDYAEGGLGVSSYVPMGIAGFDASCMSIYLHTDITTPGTSSTRDSAKAVFDELRWTWNNMQKALLDPRDSFAWLNPEYPTARLVEGPRKWWPRDAQHPDPIIEDRIGNNIRIHLPTTYKTQEDGHRACGADFQRAVFDTFLMPRWNNPSQYSCTGPGCINPFSKDPPLAGFGGYGADVADVVGRRRRLAALGLVSAPTSRYVDWDAMVSRWQAAGLFRWDLFYKMAAAAGGAIAAAALAHAALKD
jgi:hypothetical protein